MAWFVFIGPAGEHVHRDWNTKKWCVGGKLDCQIENEDEKTFNPNIK